MPAWSTQLAEVALPIHFKVRNIEATERAAAADAAKRQGNIAPIATARYRFNNNEAAPKLHPLLGDFIESYDPSVPRDPLIEQQLQQMKQEEPKHKRSADDHALEQYRKVSFTFHINRGCANILCNTFHLTSAEANESSPIEVEVCETFSCIDSHYVKLPEMLNTRKPVNLACNYCT